MQNKSIKDLKSILIIEDDQDVESLVKLSLEKMGGMKVHCAAKSPKKTSYLVDLVLLDIIEPEKTLKNMIQSVRRKYKLENTPIIMLTAKHSLKMNEEHKLEGIIGVIYKPFDPIRLSKEIKKLWEDNQNKNLEFELRFSELTKKYIGSLADKCAFIKSHWEELSEQSWNQETFNELYKMVHHLSGTGGTFKYPEISEHAKKITQMLQCVAENKGALVQDKRKIANEIERLKNCCEWIVGMNKSNKNVI